MKKVLVSIFTLIFIISMITVSNAASGSVTASASAKQVVKGNTFQITLVGTADYPIDGFYSKINYDKTILELESKVTATNYSDNSGEGEIYITNTSSTASPSSATLYTLTFKVLETASVESTTIEFSDSELHLNVDAAQEKISTEIGSVTVTVKVDDTLVGNEDNGDNGNEEQTPSNKPKDDGDNSGDKSTDTTKPTNSGSKKDSKLPQTGIENIGIIAIAGLSIFAVISYRLYKKYNNI